MLAAPPPESMWQPSVPVIQAEPYRMLGPCEADRKLTDEATRSSRRAFSFSDG